MVKTCPGCSAQIEDNVRYCSYCGTENPIVQTHKQTNIYAAPPQYNPITAQPKQGYSNTARPQYNPPQHQYNPSQNSYSAAPQSGYVKPRKDKATAAVLALFLGWFGVHKFYMNKTGSGVLYLLFCWTGIPAIAAFIEFLMYLLDSDEAFQRRIPA